MTFELKFYIWDNITIS